MERVSEALSTGRTIRPSAAHPDHLAPLDSVLMALQDTQCAWCQAMLKLILKHLEVDIPAGWEVLN